MNKETKTTRIYGVYTISFIIAIVFYFYPVKDNELLNLQDYLIAVSGIIFAFVTTYSISNIYSIKNERRNELSRIENDLRYITVFRQIVHFTLEDRKFWLKYKDIERVKREYPDINYEKLNSGRNGYEELRNDTSYSFSTLDLYFAMQSLSNDGPKGISETVPPWQIGNTPRFSYSITDIERIEKICGTIVSFLDTRFQKYGEGNFNNHIENEQSDFVLDNLIAEVIKKRENGNITRMELASIASNILDKMSSIKETIIINSGFPIILKLALLRAIYILVFGVVGPVVLLSIAVNVCVEIPLSLICVLLTVHQLLLFIVEFVNGAEIELEASINSITD